MKMRVPGFALAASLLLVSSFHAAEPANHPIVAGFERMQAAEKQDAVASGQLLLSELNCTSCHQITDATIGRKQAPNLDNVGSRVHVAWLRKYLHDPQAAKPGTTMPNLFAQDSDKDQKIEALVHFLASTGPLKQERPDIKGIIVGRNLYHQVGCVACHGPRDGSGKAAKQPPFTVPLGDLKAKYSIAGLAAFLENPLHVRPSGRMPRVVAGKDAKDIANYLLQGAAVDLPVSPGSTKYSYYEGTWDRIPKMNKLKAEDSGMAPAFDIQVAKRGNDFAIHFEGFFKAEKTGKYTFTLHSDDGSRIYLDDKPVAEADGIHPVETAQGIVELKEGTHRVAVDFFQAGGEAVLTVEIEGPGIGRQDFAPLVASTEEGLNKPAPKQKKNDDDCIEIQPELVKKGQALFKSLGCANCHQMSIDKKPLVPALKPTALDKLKSNGGCLAEKPMNGSPWYSLSPEQRANLATAIQKPTPPSKDPQITIARTLAAFNCYACHSRNGIGGPDESVSKYFTTTQPEMGEEGRIPPPLDGVGAKLNLDYLKNILANGSHDRPYMHTRMPAFGAENIGHLATVFASVDKLPSAPTVTFADSIGKVKSAGRHMVSGSAFGCVKCHTFAGNKAEGVQGIDMTLMSQRIRHDWFHAYLIDPQKIRPGTRMPSSWFNNASPLPKILDGKPATQIEAIWLYLQDGPRAQVPPGMKKNSIPQVPEKNAIIYRNFIEGAGPRGIGVGYPEQVNLTFDANDMCLSMIWQGAFIDAGRHWSDRGSGFEPPLGDNVLHLHQGAGFARLEKPDQAWPTKPPKEQGWKFNGYRLSSDDRPTFLYSLGGIHAEDFPNAGSSRDMSLRRTLTVTAEKPMDDLFFRAAVGNKIEAIGGGYRIDGHWTLKIESGAKRIVRLSNGKTELLVPVKFEGNVAKFVLEYVW
ncbi:MAG TPA: c-type cytochrome [Gemmataceae bacterium]|nr:c-type cytochrome [Gemmataceae bacterium]